MTDVTSRDGTKIAYSRAGEGPALVLVDGALNTRTFGPNPDLAKLLADHFTVYTYDRRGRGDSGDTAPYAIEREVEDVEAVIEAAGGSAYLYGISSGAALALEAATRLSSVKKLALYEAPFVVDATRPPTPSDCGARIGELVAAGKRSAAVKLFMAKGVNLPGAVVALMPLMPAWKQLKAVAHTLPYDLALVQHAQAGKPLPADRWSALAVPTLVVGGTKSPQWMRNGVEALAGTLPGARHRALPGQTHIVKAAALAPVLREFFGG
ncbi:alpha/beta fold hydrolase [Amycolatopsis sp. H20-H5]|uniref:alpha/beta fold hydrolase n=1 Tax=Amycolatopsis sp. H20-H5 TaxID=3046309 RepID=UPI002DBEEFD7|nr:alpha/beta hydrolase [Amycolatopsis sp. H20-H5]MEC3975128.1 alpha/beta hydrolase [Amycolatopsis sp. H20-H5]